VGKCKQQSFSDCDKLGHLLATAVKYYLEAEAIEKWNSKDFPSKWQKTCRHKHTKAQLQGGSRRQTAIQNTENS